MDDLISRQAAIDAMETWDWQELYLPIHFKQLLEELPPAQSEYTEQDMREQFNAGYACGMCAAQPERKRGKWLSVDAVFGGGPYRCSECGEISRDTILGEPRWNYCPHCGADMREGNNEQQGNREPD